MTPSRLPGSRWVAGLRSPTLRVGLLTGVYLIAVMAGSLLAANRMPWLEGFAQARNSVSYGLFLLLMLIPVAYFRRAPANLFACGMVGWCLLTLAYAITGEFIFTNLFSYPISQSPFHLFVLGGVIYGTLAVVAWVGSLLTAARRHPIVSSRRPH